MENSIVIKGARANNLKNIDIEIPRDKLIVMTGVSGSGKSSLAFDTIYAEGQRRYVESLSSYARQFLGQMDKPDLDNIQGLSPAISIDQKTSSRNPRSTVGTVTEIYDYMRLLWARIGVPHCPKCGKEIKQQTIDQIIDQLMLLPEGTKLQILAPVVRARKGEYVKVFEDARKSGYVRARVDGSIYDLSETIKLEKNKKHNIEIIVDRIVIKPEITRRLTDSVETAASLANGLVIADIISEKREILFSQNYACEDCGISIEELTPRMFSFNTPYGACPTCDGLGMQLLVDPELIVPDESLSLAAGAVQASGWASGANDSIAKMYYTALAKKYGFTLDTPFKKLPKAAKDALFYGTKGEPLDLLYERESKSGSFSGKYSKPFEGICNNLERRYHETQSPAMRADIEEVMSEITCPTCGGLRLRKEALAVTVGGKNIAQMSDMSITEAIDFVDSLVLTEKQQIIAAQILKEIKVRLGFLKNVGLQYLTLSRGAVTLSGGESQRIRLATQIGSSLMGVLYILDEPSIGLHQRDNEKLLKTLKDLRDLGNTLIVVEHDEDTMYAADHIIDIGPGAGANGGRVVAEGTGMRAWVKGYRVGGKTGTAQKIDPKTRTYGHEYMANFVGIAPIDDPNVVVVVMVDAPRPQHSGGFVAAPVFAEIVSQILPYRGVYPKSVDDGIADPFDKEAYRAAARRAADAPPIVAPHRPESCPQTVTVPDFAGMTAYHALQFAKANCLGANILHAGYVTAQWPPSGSTVSAHTRVELTMANYYK